MATSDRVRFGIGEWYGRPFTELSPDERRKFAQIQLQPKDQRPELPCPFLSRPTETVRCGKEGGVCSLRLYQESAETHEVSVAFEDGELRTTCPSRFEEDRIIYRWIGEELLGNPAATPIGQVNFLRRTPLMGSAEFQPSSAEEVGRIDNVLIIPGSTPLQWCAVEIQAVYFSGTRMSVEFEALVNAREALPFPSAHRRPDYRSSGPKRLMPQLQIKVPTLSRWGRKMAVVVDDQFFRALGRMELANDISNCDVVWFVVKYNDAHELAPSEIYLTTLEQSVSGLVAAQPVSQQEFEQRIQDKYSRLGPSPAEISADD